VQSGIELANGLGVWVLNLGVGDSAGPQDIVDDDEPSRANELEALLKVVTHVELVGVDKGQVKDLGTLLKLLQGGGGGTEMKLDLGFYPGFLPIAPSELSKLRVEFAGVELALVGQGEGHASGAVAGKNANLEHAPGLHEAHQEIEKLALLGYDLHGHQGMAGGVLTNFLQNGMFAQRNREQVVVNFGTETHGFHGGICSLQRGFPCARNEDGAMKLYAYYGACSLAPHIALHELGLDHEIVPLNLRKGEGQTPQHLERNPTGAVPVLELEDGSHLTEVMAILLYLASLKPECGWVPAPPFALYERLSFIASELHKSFYPIFFGQTLVTDPDAVKQLADGYKQRLRVRWSRISQWLGEGDYLLTSFGPADIYLYVILTWWIAVGENLDEWPNLKAFMQRMEGRAGVQAALAHEKLKPAG